jgi:hypothetical protein
MNTKAPSYHKRQSVTCSSGPEQSKVLNTLRGRAVDIDEWRSIQGDFAKLQREVQESDERWPRSFPAQMAWNPPCEPRPDNSKAERTILY